MKTSLIFTTLLLTSLLHAAPVQQLNFVITKGTNPGGQGGYTGKVSFSRVGPDAPFEVNWELTNGKLKGLAVPFPGTDYIAVGYGRDLGGIAIYKRNVDGGSDAQFCLASPDAKITSYAIEPTEKPGTFNYKGGVQGNVVATPGAERIFDMTWNLESGSYKGIGVADGDFLATVSSTGGPDVGVVLYKKSEDGAMGWWRYNGMAGFGLEILQVTAIDGAATAAGTSAIVPNDAAAAVTEICRNLRGTSALLKHMRPDASQIAAIAATPEDAEKLTAYVENMFENLPPNGLVGDPDETSEIVVSGKELPGGYTQYASHISSKVAIFGFKYVAPGKTIGTAFDGLVYVNGSWVMIPKMWRAFAK